MNIEIKIYKNNLFDSTYNNVINAPNINNFDVAMLLNSPKTIIVQSLTLKNQEGSIRVDKSAFSDNMSQYNYLSFSNDSKIYYAFIKYIKMCNNSTYELIFEIDIWSTYNKDFNIIDAFISRQHQPRFEIKQGIKQPIFNRVPENLEIGDDYITTNTFENDNKFDTGNELIEVSWCYIFTTNRFNEEKATTHYICDGSYYNLGYCIYVFPIFKNKQVYAHNTNSEHYSQAVISKINDVADVLSIRYSSIAPCEYFITTNSQGTLEFKFETTYSCTDLEFIDAGNLASDGYPIHFISWIEQQYNENTLFEFDYTAPQYTKNSNFDSDNEPKLLTFPYTKFRLSNGNDYIDYSLDNVIKNNKLKIKTTKPLSLDGGVVIMPNKKRQYYKAFNTKYDIALRTDYWKNYERQNQSTLKSGLLVNTTASVLSTAVGVASGGVGLAFGVSQGISQATQVANELMKRQDIKQTPDDVRGTGGDTLNIMQSYSIRYYMDVMQIKETFKNRIAQYFHRYGYACNDFAQPNFNNRYYFNFIKATNITFDCSLNKTIIDKIIQIFENGVTIWHYRTNADWHGVGYYLKENAEV